MSTEAREAMAPGEAARATRRYVEVLKGSPQSVALGVVEERLERALRDIRRAHSNEWKYWAHQHGNRWVVRFEYRCAARDLIVSLRVLRVAMGTSR